MGNRLDSHSYQSYYQDMEPTETEERGMKELGYYNGRIGELSEMTVPMTDRACWFGDGVYDAQMVRNYRIFTLDEHVERFFRSAELLRLRMPMTRGELKALLNDLVRKMDSGDLMLYYQLTRGAGPRGHAFPACEPNLWVTLVPKKIIDPAEPVGLVTTEDTRFLHCNIKTLNLIPSVMASQRAAEAGCYESVFYRPGGRVTECSHSNVHILRDGVLYTAPTDHLILAGIARAHLLAACERLGIPVREEPFFLSDLMAADEIITTSSSALCLRACSVDGIAAGMRDESLYRKLHDEVTAEYERETA